MTGRFPRLARTVDERDVSLCQDAHEESQRLAEMARELLAAIRASVTLTTRERSALLGAATELDTLLSGIEAADAGFVAELTTR